MAHLLLRDAPSVHRASVRRVDRRREEAVGRSRSRRRDTAIRIIETQGFDGQHLQQANQHDPARALLARLLAHQLHRVASQCSPRTCITCGNSKTQRWEAGLWNMATT